MDSIDTLTLFTKHYKEPQDLGEEDENEGVEEMKNQGAEQEEDNDMYDD